MTRSLRSLALVASLAVLLASSSSASVAPGRSVVTSLPVSGLALTGSTLAYVADHPTRLACARTGVWRPSSGKRFSIDANEQCSELASTGQGVEDVSVATSRLLWLTYTGGNTREWSLWTATTTRRTPRRLRFLARDAGAPAPIVLGPGAAEAIPYAVGAEVVYLSNNGRALFRRTLEAPVRALASHPSTRRYGATVVALLASNALVGLDGTGSEVFRMDVPPGVTAIAYDDRNAVVYQLGDVVHADGAQVVLPRGASMVDAARGQILWTRAGDLGVTAIGTGASRRLVDGSSARPAHGQIELSGLAWGQGRGLRWRPGRLP